MIADASSIDGSSIHASTQNIIGMGAALQRAAQAAGSGSDLSDSLAQLLAAAVELAGAERGWLALRAADDAVWEVMAQQGVEAAGEPGAFPPAGPGEALVEAVLRSGAGQVAAGPILMLCAPLRLSGQILGVIYMVGGSQAEGPARFALAGVEMIASQAALLVENARLRADVQEAVQSKSKFVSVVTHELRIPMTSIKGYTDLLRAGVVGPVNEQQLQFLNVVRSNVERMSALVSDLSDISRAESGRLKIEKGWVSLAGVLDDLLLTLQPRLEEKRQALEVQDLADLPQVYADRSRVAQVLTNLINNAHKYTPEDGRIWVHARPEGDFLRLEVGDTGIGISEADQERLFTAFFRSEDQAVRDQPGWGLGLHVSQRLVGLMGGSIGAQSELGQGSRFWFTLPLKDD